MLTFSLGRGRVVWARAAYMLILSLGRRGGDGPLHVDLKCWASGGARDMLNLSFGRGGVPHMLIKKMGGTEPLTFSF